MGDYGSDFTKALQTQLRQLIHYAKGADATLQREVAEKLANEAVKPDRQEQIVELGGLELLLPLVVQDRCDKQRPHAEALSPGEQKGTGKIRPVGLRGGWGL